MKRAIFVLLTVILLLPAAVIAFEFWHEPGSDIQGKPVANAAEQIARGEYLARAGNCMGCHTARGGAVNAGGLTLTTPFGDVYAPNITPDVATGIGTWMADDFWRAMHNGKSKDGRLLYPAFPYNNYTKVTREDSDAIFAFLQTVPAVHEPNREHELRFPYNQQVLLAGWRALYFRPGVYEPETGRSAEWNRGAYLVGGLGHCSACHAERNQFGASVNAEALGGAMMPGESWYAPSLQPAQSREDAQEAAAMRSLLRTGVSQHGAVFGPMAEVVRHSLQHLSVADIDAMTGYLMSLPAVSLPVVAQAVEQTEEDKIVLQAGARLYEKNCAECHGDKGEGVPNRYPALAGNRSMLNGSSVNAIRMIVNGGYPPSTEGNPRPFGMPPYGPFMTDTEIASLVSYINTSWGNRGEFVSPLTVSRYRGVPVE
jgi:mono/diheme cytochrome c family protein